MKENFSLLFTIGGFILGLFGFIGWLGVTPQMVGGTAYSIFFRLLPALMFVGGFLCAWGFKQRRTSKLLGVSVKEAASRLDEIDQKISLTEIQFRNMSFRAKGICYIPAKEGKREVSGKEDAGIDFEDPEWKEAVGAGFLLVEECGTHQHRVLPTEKLTNLIKSKPEMLKELHRDHVNDFIQNFQIRQTKKEGELAYVTEVVDKFTGETSDSWRIGASRGTK